MKRRYLKFEGLIYRPSGWTKKQQDEFTDKLIELAESFDKNAQLYSHSKRLTEAELEDE